MYEEICKRCRQVFFTPEQLKGHVCVAALAASGTEAAPREILDALQRHVTSSESMRETFERIGDAKAASMQAGITAGLLRAIEVVNYSPQAAASPEGEGREDYPYSDHWMRLRSYLKETLSPRQYDKAKELLEAALRQSAAPSADWTMVASKINRILIERHPVLRSESLLNDMRNVIAGVLAQESKTGAVTERRDGK